LIELKPLELDKIFYGDCGTILRMEKNNLRKYWQKTGYELLDQFADLVYMDPPFFSNKKYEVIWGDGAEIRSFNDSHWYEDGKRRNSINAYLAFMRDRVEACYDVLKPTGSFYLHCDWHASHYLKKMCDEIFGYNNFRNEIIWYYKHMSNVKKDFARKHDTILRYTKSNEFVFNLNDVRQPYDDQTIKRYKTPVVFPKGYEAKINSLGKIPDDVWIIPPIRNVSKERIGYPTQKPEAVLERIIKASSNPGDIVLDPFCGCGTTAIVSRKLKRHFIGIDVSYTACKVMQNRFKDLNLGEIEICNRPFNGKESRTIPPIDFQNLVIGQLGMGAKSNPKKTSDMGIDGWDGNQNPVQVKQSEHVGRQVIDQFSTAIRRYFLQEGKRNKENRGIIICYSLTSGAWDEIKRLEHEENIDINAITIGKKDSIDRIEERWNRINNKRRGVLD